MPRILVTYATNSGSTQEVAEAIGEEIAKDDRLSVDVHRIDEVARLDDYDAVVLGAPMILGWHRGARSFYKKHREILSAKKVALFCTAMSLTQTGETRYAQTPLCVDPDLAQPPKNPGRLSIKEKYATLANYLKPIYQSAPQVKPVSLGMFGGKLEMFRLPFWQMAFVMVIIQAQPGDMRNWQLIRDWAAELRSNFAI